MFTFAISLLTILASLLVFFRLRSKPSTKIEESSETYSKTSKKKNGALQKELDQSSPKKSVLSSQNTTTISPEQIKILNKQKYTQLIKKFKDFSAITSDLEIIKKHLRITQKVNNAKYGSLYLEAENLKTIQPKNQDEYITMKQTEKTLDQQMSSIKSFFESNKKKLDTIDKLMDLIEEATEINYSIDNLDALNSLVTNLTDLYEILNNVHQEQDQAIIKMLDFTRTKVMKLVEPIVTAVSRQFNDLKSVSKEYEIKIDFTDLENANKNLVDALSTLTELVHINYHGMTAIELDQHAENVVKAERVLNPDHPLRRAVEESYRMTQDFIKAPYLKY